MMIAIGGMSGSGKSTLAKTLHRKIPSSVLLDADEVRKQMFGVSPRTTLPESAYTPENIEKFIRHAHAEAHRHLKNGKTVIVTGLFLDPKTRLDQENIARAQGVPFLGIYLHAPLGMLYGRVVRRQGSASDADLKVVRRQARKAPLNPHHEINWHILFAREKQVSLVLKALRLVDEIKTRHAFTPPPTGKPPAP